MSSQQDFARKGWWNESWFLKLNVQHGAVLYSIWPDTEKKAEDLLVKQLNDIATLPHSERIDSYVLELMVFTRCKAS